MVLSCASISKAFGADVIIENITFLLNAGEKAAIVGVNGAGKTTLLKIIAGELPADSGSVVIPKELALGYLSQMTHMENSNTIYEEMLSVFSGVIQMEREIRELEICMAELEGDDLNKVMDRYSRLSHDFEERKGYEYESRLRGVIKGLGFDNEGRTQKIGRLSGGEKTRVSLGKLLLTAPDLLLLDEPTNHLDVNSIEWLEDFLKNYSGAVIIVSHDRYFIDRTVSKIIEIENGKSSVYDGDYKSYSIKKAEDREIKLRHYLGQQREIHRQEEVIKTLRSFNREKSIKRAESREKMLEKMVIVDKPENEPTKMRIQLALKKQSGTDVLSVKGISKAFGERQLFKDMSFQIKKGEKIALLGANGIGKTTLFRMILESMPMDSGEIKFGYNVTIGYYDQEHQNLDDSRTVLEEVTSASPDVNTGEIRNILAAFVFIGDDVFKKVGTLSGGEKGRVALAKLMLQGCNFLMLDEPTNHLDIFSKEILEGALNSYEGTIFYISHDRYFVNNTAVKILELTEDGIKEYLGNYDYYLEKKNELRIEIDKTLEKTVVDTAVDYKMKKEKQSEERRRQTQLLKTENEIHKLEKLVSELDNRLSEPEVCADYEGAHKIFMQKQECEEQLLELYSLWETFS